MQIKKLLILTSGGDAPGMNAAIRAALRTALHHEVEVYACQGGYQGLVEHSLFPLKSSDVANIIQRGGTVLKTGRSDAFCQKDVRDACRLYLQKLQIDAMLVLGGNGSFYGADIFEKEGGPKTIGIPCTIDNDIVGTDYSIGFDTACNTALEAIDKLRDTAFSISRNFLIEVMGRSSGFLAVDVGIAGGAEFILIPEETLNMENLARNIKKQHQGKKLASIIVVAETNKPGRSLKIAEEIKKLSGIEYKVVILGHIQRGGTPTVNDRKVASLMGHYAVEALLKGESNKMVAIKQDEVILAPFPEVNSVARRFQNNQLLRINEIICGL